MPHALAIPGLRFTRVVPTQAPDFRAILGERAWGQLPAAVQARFVQHLSRTVYPGSMQVRASWLGLALAQLCRLIGTPLAPFTAEDVAVTVEVYPDRTGALVWDRRYAFQGRKPVLVTSRKAMDRTHGLVEVVRCGVGMALRLTVEDGALHFRSRRYFLALGPARLPLPLLLTPGEAHVVHADEGGGLFRFTMTFTHPWFGRLYFQTGLFRDPAPEARP